MRFFLSWIAVLTCFNLNSQELSTELRKELDDLVLADVREGSPGLAVGVVKDGEVVYERYAGLADIEAGRLIDSNTMFNLASLAKQFTALSILKLSEESSLGLEDDVREYLPELYPKIKAPITITHLLNHRSGIRDISNLLSLQGITWWEAKLNNNDALKLLSKQNSLNFTPGSDRSYSNSNYILLTHIVARVSGQSFKAYAEEMLTELSMPNTIFHDNFRQPIKNIAEPYFNFDSWFNYDLKSDLHGDGALYSTLTDQLHWEAFLQRNARNAGAKNTLLTKSQQPLGGDGSYGFGLEFGDYRGIPYRYHAGVTGAWKAMTLRFPKQHLSVFVATNSGAIWPPGLARECADRLLGLVGSAKDEIPTEPKCIGPALATAEILGTYRTPGGYFCEIKEVEDTLFLSRFGRDDIRIEAVKGSLFQEVTDVAFKQHFFRNADDEMMLTFYYPGVDTFDFVQQKLEAELENPLVLNGSYRNYELGVEVNITHLKGREYLIQAGGEELNGRLIGQQEMILSGYRLEIIFNKRGGVDHFMLYDQRLERVRFDRI